MPVCGVAISEHESKTPRRALGSSRTRLRRARRRIHHHPQSAAIRTAVPASASSPDAAAALRLRAAGGHVSQGGRGHHRAEIGHARRAGVLQSEQREPRRRIHFPDSEGRASRQVHDADRRQGRGGRAARRGEGARDLRGHRAPAEGPRSARIHGPRGVPRAHFPHRAAFAEKGDARVPSCSKWTAVSRRISIR